jgi:copper chaperone
MNSDTDELTYSVPGVSCGHCRSAIASEIEQLPGVTAVDVDLETKTVTVQGRDLDDGAVRGAIDDAGYDVAGAKAA